MKNYFTISEFAKKSIVNNVMLETYSFETRASELQKVEFKGEVW